MPALRSLSRAALGLIAAALPLLFALSLPGQPAPSLDTPRQIADNLDAIIQPRFQDLTAGSFGMSRVVQPIQGHESVALIGDDGYKPLRTKTTAEADKLERADAAHRPYVIAFLHCAAIPGAGPFPFGPSQPSMGGGFGGGFGLRTPAAVPDPRTISPFSTLAVSGRLGRYSPQAESLLSSAAVKVLPQAMKGKPVSASAGEWTLFLRPVMASQSACLTCHTAAKPSDTLGVMVYAVDNAPQTRRSRSRAMSSDWRPGPA